MRKLVIVLFAVAVCGTAVAQAPLSVEQLPDWTRAKWATLARARALEVSTRINPFVWRGDFDGDQRQDVAMFVKSASGKEGIAIILRNASVPVLVGAGSELGNGGDDFSWLDFWSVVEADPAKTNTDADRLLVAKDGAASALIVLEKGKPIWQQQGD